MAKPTRSNNKGSKNKPTKHGKKIDKTSVQKVKAEKKSHSKKTEKSMSVEDFFNGGFAMSSDEDALDKDLQQLEQVAVNESDNDDDEFFKVPESVKEAVKEDVDMVDSDIDDELEEHSDVENKHLTVMDEESEQENDDGDDDNDNASESDQDMTDNEDNAVDTSDQENDEDDSKDKIRKDAKKHKTEMEELKKRDPEFYKFLEKEDAELLDFDMSEDEEDEEKENDDNDNDSENEYASDDEQGDDQEISMQNDKSLITVTKSMLAKWVEQIKATGDSKSSKRLLAAFKSATRMADEEEREKTTFIYKVTDPNVFNEVLTSAMRYAPVIFDRYLQPKTKDASPRSSHRWNFWQTVVKSYLTSLLYLLNTLTDADMQYLAIHEAEKCTVYWTCFEKLSKDYLKALLNLYSSLGSSDNVRIQSFLAIRTLASSQVTTKKKQQVPFLDVCLRNIYLTFVRSCKNTNTHTLPAINLMRNLAVELYGFDQILSYQQAFVYIRQLGIHLRGAMTTKSDETFKAVYNWQYVHCIDFWSNVLSTYCQPVKDQEESPLKPLIYPLTQIALGAVRLIPTAQYFPLRFHILKSMASLCDATHVYIPLAPYVLEVFDSAELKNKAKPSTARPLDWDLHLRAPKPYLRGRTYQDGIIEQACHVLEASFKPYFHHISFPEMAIPTIVGIKRFAKRSKNAKGNRKLLDFVKKLELKSNSVLLQRTKVDFSPQSDQARYYTFA